MQPRTGRVPGARQLCWQVRPALHCPVCSPCDQAPWAPTLEGVWPLYTMLWIHLMAEVLRLCD